MDASDRRVRHVDVGIGVPHETRAIDDTDESTEHPRAKFGIELLFC